MKSWYRNYKATLYLKEYAVLGFRLYETEYYGPEGMWDNPDAIPEDEWKLEVKSWYQLRGSKEAGPLSKVRLEREFKSKSEANSVWLWIKKTEPGFDALREAGFKDSVW